MKYKERKSQKMPVLLGRAYTERLRKWRIIFLKLSLVFHTTGTSGLEKALKNKSKSIKRQLLETGTAKLKLVSKGS